MSFLPMPPPNPCWTHPHVITDVLVPAIKTAAEEKSDETLDKGSIWTSLAIQESNLFDPIRSLIKSDATLTES